MPGVRVTVTPKSVGISAGVKGARVSANSRGRVTRTVGIPGTGVSHVKTLSSGTTKRSAKAPTKRSGRASPAPQQPSPPVPSGPPTPGIFSPAWEKKLHKAVVKAPSHDSVVATGKTYPEARHVAAVIEAVQYCVPAGDQTRAHELLGWVHASGFDPATDRFWAKYLPNTTITLSVAPEVEARLPVNRDSLGLLLAELKQAGGDTAGAISVVEQLEPTSVAAVSLAELYAEMGRWQEVMELSEGISNEDESTMYLLIQRAVALREQGFLDASRDALREALRPRTRPEPMKHLALIERARTNLADNKRAQARKDLEKVLAANSAYPGVRPMLEELT